MSTLEQAATEMLQCVDRMLAHGEWYAAEETADKLRAVLIWGEPVAVQAEPVAWVGLTDKDRLDIYGQASTDEVDFYARAIEAALKEKNAKPKQAEPAVLEAARERGLEIARSLHIEEPPDADVFFAQQAEPVDLDQQVRDITAGIGLPPAKSSIVPDPILDCDCGRRWRWTDGAGWDAKQTEEREVKGFDPMSGLPFKATLRFTLDQQAEPVVEPGAIDIDDLVTEFEIQSQDNAKAIAKGRKWVADSVLEEHPQQAEPVAWPKKREPRAAEITESDEHYARSEGYDEGWNDCLAACMKQQAEPVDKALTKPAPQVQCTITTATLACKNPVKQAEPVAWMVYTEDGQSVYVTDNPADINPSQRALPLFATPQQAEPVVDYTMLHEVAEKDGVRAALKLKDKLKQQAEPVAWLYQTKLGFRKCWYADEQDDPTFLADKAATREFPDAHRLTPLYSAPQQAEPVAEPHKRAINADNDQPMSGNPSF